MTSKDSHCNTKYKSYGRRHLDTVRDVAYGVDKDLLENANVVLTHLRYPTVDHPSYYQPQRSPSAAIR